MREDQRNRLRMFVVDEFRQLLRVNLLQNIEAGIFAAHRFGKAIDNLFRDFRAECLVEHLFCIVESAAHDAIVRHVHLIKLFEQGFGVV